MSYSTDGKEWLNYNDALGKPVVSIFITVKITISKKKAVHGNFTGKKTTNSTWLLLVKLDLSSVLNIHLCTALPGIGELKSLTRG